ncbi:MAG TPA: glycine-rich protein [Chitinophagales bacterium]|nr:glycine-rich protein [Chitinophagales bacterium]
MITKLLSGILFLATTFRATSQTTTFDYTGDVQVYIVPDGVCNLEVDVQAAEGSKDGGSLGIPGKGARVTGTLPVVPGQTVLVYVGGMGTDTSGGFNGGGHGGSATLSNGPAGGGGGGASDIRFDSVRMIVAGGGGGCGGYTGTAGGDGGCTAGFQGETGAGLGGGGGTQLNGGDGGTGAGYCGYAGASGMWNFGGKGGDVDCGTGFGAGGGGGGGYYGGGGGGGAAYLFCCPDWSGGGGGGSSYTDASVVDAVCTSGYKSGNGQITITEIVCTGITGDLQMSVRIYPALFSDFIVVETYSVTSSEWTMLNAFGETINQGIILSQELKINTRALSTGVYFVQIKSADGMTVRKIVKE